MSSDLLKASKKIYNVLEAIQAGIFNRLVAEIFVTG
jgi:hypothetical protein